MRSAVKREYGLGTFNGQPLVQATCQGRCYHRKGHHDGTTTVTWTERFARDGMGLRPCRTCFPSRREAPDA